MTDPDHQRTPRARADQDEVLSGGIANAGRIIRTADTVRRPLGPQSRGVHAFLAHLDAEGIEGVPRVLDVVDGYEVLSFIPGTTASDPMPNSLLGLDVLSQVCDLQASLHRAADGFVWPTDVAPAVPYVPSGAAGMLVCHNDLNCQNVIFDGTRVVGAIDFDYSAPVNRLFDIAYMARHWVPFRHVDDLDLEWAGVDQFERFALICDAHQLSRAERETVVGFALEFFDDVLEVVRARAVANIGGFNAMWKAGYERSNRRSKDWLADNRKKLVDRH